MASTQVPPIDALSTPPRRLPASGHRAMQLYFGGGRDGARSWLFTAAFWIGLVLPFTSVGPTMDGRTLLAVPAGMLLVALWPLLPWDPGSRSGATWLFVAAALAFYATAGVGYSNFIFVVVLAQLAMTWGLLPGIALCVGLSLLVGVAAMLRFGVGLADGASQVLGMLTMLGFVLAMAHLAARERMERRRTAALVEQLAAANAELEHRAQRIRELAVGEERARLAREVHDAAGHHLTVVKLCLANAQRSRASDEEGAWQAVSDARQAAGLALDEIRRSVKALGPAPLAQAQLGAALHKLVASYGSGEPAVNLVVEGNPASVSADTDAALYRVAEEALTNAHRHAEGVTRVDVRLAYDAQSVQLEVTDDGCGGQLVEGFGLTGIRARLAAIGGELRVNPASTGGLQLAARVPLEAAR